MIEVMANAQFDASFASACIERVAASLNDTPVTAIPTKEGALEEAIALQLVKRYGLTMPVSEPMQSTQSLNALFHIVTGDDAWVLKLFKVSGNFPLSRVAEHTYYEALLVRALTERHIDTASIHPTVDGVLVSIIAGIPAILFEKLSGSRVRRDDCPLKNIVAALAGMHAVQLEQPLTVDAGFHFDDAIMLWLPLFHRYRFDTSIEVEITSVLNRFAPLVEALNAGERRDALYSRSPLLHCHGDVTPGNVMMDSTGKAWIFDFNHAFYGPRLADVIDGAFQFHLADFAHFDAFLNNYLQVAPLSDEELADLPDWIALEGIMLLTKAVRVLRDSGMQSQHEIYRKRFHRISEILSRLNDARAPIF